MQSTYSSTDLLSMKKAAHIQARGSKGLGRELHPCKRNLEGPILFRYLAGTGPNGPNHCITQAFPWETKQILFFLEENFLTAFPTVECNGHHFIATTSTEQGSGLDWVVDWSRVVEWIVREITCYL